MKQFLKMSYLDFKGHMGPFCLEEFLSLETLYPFLTMAFYCLLAGYAYQTSDVSEWVIGNSFLLCTTTCVFTLGIAFTGERSNGRIRSIVTSPVSKVLIVFEKGFFPCLVCIVTTFAGFLAGAAVFQISLAHVNWLVYFAILFVAMMFVSTFGLMTDQMHLILNTLSYIILIFTGANFPVSQLPAAGRAVSWILPLTRSIRAAKLMMQSGELSQIGSLMTQEAVLAVIYIVLAGGMVHHVERKAVQSGTLELF